MQTAIREISPPEAQRRHAAGRDPDRRARAGRVGRRPHRRRAVHPARPVVLDQIAAAVPDQRRGDRPVLPERRALRARHARLQALGYTNVVNMAGGILEWEANSLPVDAPATPDAGPAVALQPAPAHPRGRDRGPGQAARLEGADRRRGRARQPGGAVPRRGGCRHARHRRLRRRRGEQPPAPGHPFDRAPRRQEGRIRPADHPGAQPRREGRRHTTRCSWPTTSSG